MKSIIKALLMEYLRNYPMIKIKVAECTLDLHIFSKLEEQEFSEGFLFSEIDGDKLNYLLDTELPSVHGSTPRIGFFLLDSQFIVKDYLRGAVIRKTLQKVDSSFLAKLKRALSNPGEYQFHKLFDRYDTIDDFYVLCRNTRDYFLRNLIGFKSESSGRRFVNKLVVQMLALWYLQEKGFFNNDTSYFVTKFKEIQNRKQNDGFRNFCCFLSYFFEKMRSKSSDRSFNDKKLGEVAITGSKVFLIDSQVLNVISLPDECFYKKGLTEKLLHTILRHVNFDVPLLNLLESREWMEGNFDDKVIGAIYEKILTENPSKRKSTGSYYTPEEIAAYICKHTVEKCLLDRINDRFSENYSSLDSIVNSHSVTHLSSLVDELKEIKILDPAVGSGYFLDSIIRELLSIYHKIRSVNEELDLSLGLHTTIPFNNDSSKRMNLLEIDDEEEFELLLKYSIIFPRNIYGVDINPNAVEIVKIRLFLSLVKHSYTKNFDIVHLSSFRFNLRTGNALISSTRLKRESKVDYEYLKIINWHSEFPEVFENRRGFDIIIGNPPYVNPSDVDYWHLLEDSKNLYDAFIRLSVTLLTEGGRLGFIHPNSAYCQPKFRELREFLKVNTDDLTIINFAIRPQPVFKGIMQRTAITTCKRETNGCKTVKTSRYLRLTGTNRNELLKNPPVFDSSDIAWKFANFIPKIGNDLDHSIFCKVFSQEKAISDIIDKKTGRILYYHDSGESYWTKLILDEPVGIRNGKKVRASHWRKIQVLPEYLYFLACYINSSLFYWIWLTISDCRDLTLETLMQTPVPSIQAITGEYSDNLKFYTKQLMQCYRDNSKYVEKRPGYASLEFRVNRCKELINEIDQVIGRIFKLNDCEIKYLVDYDREMRTG